MGSNAPISRPDTVALSLAQGMGVEQVARSARLSPQALAALMPYILERYGVNGYSSLAVHAAKYLLPPEVRAEQIAQARAAVAGLPMVSFVQARLLDLLRHPQFCDLSVPQIANQLHINKKAAIKNINWLADCLACPPTVHGLAVILQMALEETSPVVPVKESIDPATLTTAEQCAITIAMQGYSFTKTISLMPGGRRTNEKLLGLLLRRAGASDMPGLCVWVLRHVATDEQRFGWYQSRHFIKPPANRTHRLLNLLVDPRYLDASQGRIARALGVGVKTIWRYMNDLYKLLPEDCPHTRVNVVIALELERLTKE